MGIGVFFPVGKNRSLNANVVPRFESSFRDYRHPADCSARHCGSLDDIFRPEVDQQAA